MPALITASSSTETRLLLAPSRYPTMPLTPLVVPLPAPSDSWIWSILFSVPISIEPAVSFAPCATATRLLASAKPTAKVPPTALSPPPFKPSLPASDVSNCFDAAFIASSLPALMLAFLPINTRALLLISVATALPASAIVAGFSCSPGPLLPPLALPAVKLR